MDTIKLKVGPHVSLAHPLAPLAPTGTGRRIVAITGVPPGVSPAEVRQAYSGTVDLSGQDTVSYSALGARQIIHPGGGR